MKHLGILFSCCIIFLGCAREVFIDLPEYPAQVVAIGHFQPGLPFRVELSWSKSVFDSSAFDPILQADVSVAKQGQLYEKLIRKSNETFFKGKDKYPQADSAYTLLVRVPGEPLLEATCTLPKFIPLEAIMVDSSQIKKIQFPDSDTVLWSIPLILKPQFLPNQGRYFAFQVYSENLTIGDHGTVTSRYVPAFYGVDSRTQSLIHNITDAEPVILINENFWNENHNSLQINAIIQANTRLERPVQLFVEWRTLSLEFYRYHLSLDRQGQYLPLSDPDAVYNNVQNGIGNFSGYSVGIQAINIE